jgi:uncharacterized protein YlxW (UPF0749 family)
VAALERDLEAAQAGSRTAEERPAGEDRYEADRQQFEQQLVAAQRQFEQERRNLQAEVQKYRREIALLSETLGSFGIHLPQSR